MMKKVLKTTLLLLLTAVFSTAAYASNDNLVASLDDQKVTVEVLTTYVDEVAGINYKSWLADRPGLRKLADFYINRTLLLEYAKLNVDKKNTIVTNHSARSVDADVMLLTSLLQSEIQDKVHVTEEDIRTYMAEKKISTEKLAKQEIESELKNQLMDVLVKKVRTGHDIKYFN